MILSTLFSMICMAIYTVLTFHPLENNDLNKFCTIMALIMYAIMMQIANNCYNKLKARIKALEDKEETI